MQGTGGVRVRQARLVVLLAIGLLGFLVVVGCAANRMVFQPSTVMEGSPADLKRPYEMCSVRTDVLRLVCDAAAVRQRNCAASRPARFSLTQSG